MNKRIGSFGVWASLALTAAGLSGCAREDFTPTAAAAEAPVQPADGPAKPAAETPAKETPAAAEPESDWVGEALSHLQAGEEEEGKKLLLAGLAREPKNRSARLVECVLFYREWAAAEKAAKAQTKADKAAAAEGMPVDEAKTAAAAKAVAAAARTFVAKAQGMKTDFPEPEGNEPGIHRRAREMHFEILAEDGKTDEALALAAEIFAEDFEEIELFDKPAFAKLRENAKFKEMLAELERKLKIEAELEARKTIAENEPFPFDFKYASPEGKEYTLGAFAGKVAIVDIWGTWCPPCRMEVPHFIALQDRYKERGLAIVGINVENAESPEEEKKIVSDFVKENNINYVCVLGNDKVTESVPEFQGFPTTLFFDRSGKVRARLVGYHPERKLEAIVTLLLNEKPEEAKPEAANPKAKPEAKADSAPAAKPDDGKPEAKPEEPKPEQPQK